MLIWSEICPSRLVFSLWGVLALLWGYFENEFVRYFLRFLLFFLYSFYIYCEGFILWFPVFVVIDGYDLKFIRKLHLNWINFLGFNCYCCCYSIVSIIRYDHFLVLLRINCWGNHFLLFIVLVHFLAWIPITIIYLNY